VFAELLNPRKVSGPVVVDDEKIAFVAVNMLTRCAMAKMV
jgi:hypothetical protein